MDIAIEHDASDAEIINALQQCDKDDAVCCSDTASFVRTKTLLAKEKLQDVTVQLLDADGYAIKQVTSRKKGTQAKDGQLSARQKTVIKALEKVLLHCKKEGIQLVGYSDELVALSASIPAEEVSSAYAFDIDTHNVYKGADAIIDDNL